MNFPLFNECYACSRRKSVKFIPLAEDQGDLAVRLVELTKKEPLYSEPTVACAGCLRKLTLIEYHLHQPSKRISLNAIRKEMSEERQQKTNSPKTDREPPGTTCSDDYNCSCERCRSRFGSLPLLLRVIEERALGDRTAEPEPSTSTGAIRNPLVCQYCSKAFGHRGDFNKHLRKHTREQPYSCEVCDRKFAHTSNLHRHLRLHSGQKPFVCRNCDKSFSRKDKLESHKKSRLCQKMSKP